MKIGKVTKTLLFTLLLGIFMLSATAQLQVSGIMKDCTYDSIPYEITILDSYEEVYKPKNDSTDLIPVYKTITEYRNVSTCSPKYLVIDEERVEFEMQGYNCKVGVDEIVCDSCSDGNCDGKCSKNGGETCCRVKDGVTTCKNSVIKWTEPSALLPVKKLEVLK